MVVLRLINGIQDKLTDFSCSFKYGMYLSGISLLRNNGLLLINMYHCDHSRITIP